jgi:hypothetical protein
VMLRRSDGLVGLRLCGDGVCVRACVHRVFGCSTRTNDIQGMEVMNSGTLLVRNSEWSRSLLAAWETCPAALAGASDQAVFQLLWRDNVLGLWNHTVRMFTARRRISNGRSAFSRGSLVWHLAVKGEALAREMASKTDATILCRPYHASSAAWSSKPSP